MLKKLTKSLQARALKDLTKSLRAPGSKDLAGPLRAPALRDLAELVRAPAALTVPGDVLAGAVAAGNVRPRRLVGLAASSVCIYWAGMALND